MDEYRGGFEDRVRTPRQFAPFFFEEPLPGGTAAKGLEKALGDPAGVLTRTLYIHVPFCRSLCGFCGYFRVVPEDSRLVEAYAEAVVKQLRRLSRTPWARSGPVAAVHLGGGSPLMLGENRIARILAFIKGRFDLAPDCEITVEARAGEVDIETAAYLVSAGVNRLSVGVQSFDSKIRRMVGRNVDRIEVLATLRSLSWLRDVHVVVDMIYGLPGQSLDIWKADIDDLNHSKALGASIYPLLPAPGSLPAKGTRRPAGAFWLEEELAYFKAADELLSVDRGWGVLSPVQYSRDPGERAVYVTARGRRGDIAAVGPSAGGKIGRLTYAIESDIERYIDAQNAGRDDLSFGASYSAVYDRAAHWLDLTETHSVSKEALCAEKWGASMFEAFGNKGLVVSEDDRVRLTALGRFFAGNIAYCVGKQLKSEASSGL